MRAITAIVLLGTLLSYHGPVDVETEHNTVYRDTILTTSEWVGPLLVEHHVLFGTAGKVSFRSEHVTAFDTAVSMLPPEEHRGGRAFRFGPYQIWTRSTSEDTFQVMIDSVRIGRFLCFKDSVVVPDAMVIERRTEGYGTYGNGGLLVARGTTDTIPLWYVVDRGMPRPIVWNWEEQSPMSWEDYSENKRRMSEASKALSNALLDSSLQYRR